MDDILSKVHEAGLTLKAGSGIGYDFSTLRPRGAYVSGAGAYTSGPLSFMDIFDKMCFTVSSAGGRRGAQMATFDVRHPDVVDYIKAKREDGRLRQFNLSLLITEDFIQAVKADEQWQLAFPIREKELAEDGLSLDDPDQIVWRDWPSHENVVANEEGLVACRIYKTMPARRLWDLIMASTYDFRRAGVHPDRQGQRDEQQLVRGEHPGDQPVRDRGHASRDAVRHGADRGAVRGRLPYRGDRGHPNASRGRRGLHGRGARHGATRHDDPSGDACLHDRRERTGLQGHHRRRLRDQGDRVA